MVLRERTSASALALVRDATACALLSVLLALGAGPVVTAAGRADARATWQAYEDAMRAAEEARSRGLGDEAERHYLEAIERSRVYGPGNLRLGRAVDGLGDLFYSLERYDEAETRYLEALEIWERTLGPEQPRLATTLHNLGAVYLARGEPERARPLFTRALAIWEESFGAESDEVVLSLDANAAALQHLGRWEDAAPLIERARAIRARDPSR